MPRPPMRAHTGRIYMGGAVRHITRPDKVKEDDNFVTHGDGSVQMKPASVHNNIKPIGNPIPINSRVIQPFYAPPRVARRLPLSAEFNVPQKTGYGLPKQFQGHNGGLNTQSNFTSQGSRSLSGGGLEPKRNNIKLVL